MPLLKDGVKEKILSHCSRPFPGSMSKKMKYGLFDYKEKTKALCKRCAIMSLC